MKKHFFIFSLIIMVLYFSGCGTERLDLKVASQPNVNPDSSGHPLPVRIKTHELRNDLVFTQTDFQSLSDKPVQSLEADLIVTHSIVVYENNIFKEEKSASEFPESMRYREIRIKQDNGETVSKKVPVTRIEVLLIGADGKLTTSDKATQIVVQDFAADGTPLEHTKLIKQRDQP